MGSNRPWCLLLGFIVIFVIDNALVTAYLAARKGPVKCSAPFATDCLTSQHVLYRSTSTAVTKGCILEYIAYREDEQVTSVKDVNGSPDAPSQKRLINYALIERTLLQYKYLNGDMLVPQLFKVPKTADWPEETWGLKLGTIVSKIRSGDYHSRRKDKLEEIGFSYNPAQSTYDLFLVALLNYKKLNGDMMVPSRFIVPSDSNLWPTATWGLKLGSTVHNIRTGGSYADKTNELLDVGFYFKPVQTIYDQAKIALLNYKKLNGDMMIPAKFIVPSGSSMWPKRTWGLKLGSTVSRIRNGRSHSDRRDDLLQMGFCYDASEIQYNLAVSALLKYKELNDNMMVPCTFIVPSDSHVWPEAIWGLKLGQIVTTIRSGASHAEKRNDLISIGFYFKPTKTSYELVRMALLVYKELRDDMIVPSSFVVPANTEKWPIEVWGIKLGYIVKRIRQGRLHTDKRDDLISIGFHYTAEESEYQLIKSALLFYKELHGDLAVPLKFSVPFNSIIWPKELWSMKLGQAVSQMKNGLIFTDKREDLRRIGFFSTAHDGTYAIVRMALLNYKKIYDDLMVPQDFIIPHNCSLWRKETWGLQLGSTVNNIRAMRSYPDRQNDILSLGFCYFPLDAKYELVKLALLRFHELHGDFLVPSKYIIPYNSVLWPRETWELKLGLFVKRIRSGKEFNDKREEFQKIGFDYEVI